jgi:hypothetical protein
VCQERLLFALLLFVAGTARAREGAPAATLSDILRALDTTCVPTGSAQLAA